MRSSAKEVGKVRLRRQTARGQVNEAGPAVAAGREGIEPEGGSREESGSRDAVRARETKPARASRRRVYARRTRNAGAAAVGTAGAGVVLLARLVMAAASLIALLILLAIVLRDFDANTNNTIVKGVHEGANFFAGAFTGLIRFNGHPKRAITVDWGIALVVYLIVGGVVSSLIAGIGRGGMHFERSHRTAPTP
jgi:hypothetical protein